MSQTRLLNKKAVAGIMNQRTMIDALAANPSAPDLICRIVGNGNMIPLTRKDGSAVVDEVTGQLLEKMLVNVDVSSKLAMARPEVRQHLIDGLAAEAAGPAQAQAAHDHYNQYLNKVQLTISIVNPSDTLRQRIRNGAQITGKVILEEFEAANGDKAKRLTIDPKTIGFAAAVAGEKGAFDISAFEAEVAPLVEPTPVPAGETKKQAEARIAADLARGAQPLANPKFPDLMTVGSSI